MVVVLLVLIGGLTRAGRSSQRYWRDVNRSYAQQGAVVAEESNATAAQFTQFLIGAAGQQRSALTTQLDTLAADTRSQASQAAAMSPPSPSDGLDQPFVAAMDDRARAVSQVRTTLDGLLGLSGTKPALTADQAAHELMQAEGLLGVSDRTYATVRARFARLPGQAQLPRSQWLSNQTTAKAGSFSSLVGPLSGSQTLAVHHEVVLVTVGFEPQPLPPLTAAAAAQLEVPPTDDLQVTAVVGNQGNVKEAGVPVTARLQPAGAGRVVEVQRRVSLAAGSYQTTVLPAMRVKAGTTYTLTVSLTAPPGQTQLGPAPTYTVVIAPATPTLPTPTSSTTTTTAHPTTTTAHRTTGRHTTGHPASVPSRAP